MRNEQRLNVLKVIGYLWFLITALWAIDKMINHSILSGLFNIGFLIIILVQIDLTSVTLSPNRADTRNEASRKKGV